jgi:RNA polymerase sigma factor (TIGR02999 family)
MPRPLIRPRSGSESGVPTRWKGSLDEDRESRRSEENVSKPDSETVTEILKSLTQGNERAAEELLPLVYDELHRLAKHRMRSQRPDHTLQATALVNEAYLKLFGGGQPNWRDRDHFIAVAARAMRSVLVDHARSKQRQKRQPTGECVALDELMDSFEERAFDLIALDEALNRLGDADRLTVRVIELRFFAGLSYKEIARVLGLSVRTVEREWEAGRAWLRKEMK